jgi:glycine dehydrogenase
MTAENATLQQLENHGEFIARHIGPSDVEQAQMLQAIGFDSLPAFLEKTVPSSIRLDNPLALNGARTETESLAYLKSLASKNKIFQSNIGMGYYHTHTPAVILRNVLENPGWYTAYTPYQPEIAQGRLEALINFQQLTIDLTGLELASASLLDEATAAAESMALAKRMSKNKKATAFFIDENAYPQTKDVVKTRAEGFGFEIIEGPASEAANHDVFGALLQYPNQYGEISDLTSIIDALHNNKAIVAVAADLLSLVALKSPGEMGADAVFGSAQRFGVPMGFGGPHAAFFATRDQYKRALPGRIIGVSKDANERPALRMAMQTREQHIRREKATSNICTAQVLLANISAFYAIYHGPEGLKRIANRTHRMAKIVAQIATNAGVAVKSAHYFDTVTLETSLDQQQAMKQRATELEVNFRWHDNGLTSIAVDETTDRQAMQKIYQIITADTQKLDIDVIDSQVAAIAAIPADIVRTSEFLTHPTFNSYHTETDMLRYLKRLENKDLSLAHSMIALGSCTMKLNATAEMIPVTWPEFANIHPFAPLDQAQGYLEMIKELEDALVEITGYDAICMQPNSGAQGEYAGLLAIKKYHESRGDGHRNICLIPSSAHGTNPASAQMVSMKVIVTACDADGNVDVNDLREKAEQHKEQLAALMVTYPSTHGVYEEDIIEICEIIHANGGQVYMDGANMNAQVGVSKPGVIGSDVSHLNLHKTFCIPHGGGGPGMGPIGVKSHLAPFLANHSVTKVPTLDSNEGAVSAAPWGSASILPISWAYINMMGSEGLQLATEIALLNANYLAEKLSEHYPILYRGKQGRLAHECIVDLRPIKAETGISEVDIAKRLMDYGFHSPTMSFPVAGTFMIEPTESESKAELDRFADAMIAIRNEIKAVASGEMDAEANPLKRAPHTMNDIQSWDRPYSIAQACFPLPYVAAAKFWPSVNRIDDVYGDRNLVCACPPIEMYQD